MVSKKYAGDLEHVLATRHDNGADYWATPDGRIGVGGPFSTMESLLILSELRVPKSHEAVKGAAKAILAACREDGRVRVAPKGTIYPCHTAIAAAALCRNGFARDRRVKAMLEHLLSNRFDDGGWRCNKGGGRGPETDHSNPGVTLFALDAFRAAGMNESNPVLKQAVETLLDHWVVRVPTGPCHFGIGTQFMQVEYPFLRYNLFYYVYVLSFYANARKDTRFKEAFAALRDKLDDRGRLIVERPNRKLARLDFCSKGMPSELATKRYGEVVSNMAMR
jgi:hypothetical protein|tara:strand:+ start:456 stop:1289 length:834 start_codon:yes stop_codon:yes gene_type:complete